MCEDESKSSVIDKYKIFLITLAILMAVAFAIVYIVEMEVRSAKFEIIESNEKRVVNLENDYIGKEFGVILSDLNYIDKISSNERTIAHSFEEIETEWIYFSTERFIYDKIRFIDTDGNERIRINYSEGGAYSVSQENLRNKAERYYFKDGMNLKKDEIYVSRLDLDLDKDQVEIPYKPLIRFAKKHYDNYGNSSGVIVLDYRANDFLDAFKKITYYSKGEMALLNSDGYWLSSENTELEWLFMFPDEKSTTFASQYPTEWNAILRGRQQFLTPNGLFTSEIVDLETRIDSEQKNKVLFGDGQWYIISIVHRNGEHASLFFDIKSDFIINLLKEDSIYFALIIVISILIAYLFNRDRSTYSKIRYYSEYDALTKVHNRRAGITRLNEMFPVNDRRHFLVSICFVDVNGLKMVNDLLGHKMGDELIVTVADVIKSVIRDNDFIIRMGGDEFLIVFDDLDLEGAELVWDRIVEIFDHINDIEFRPYLISVSHGVVSHDNKETIEVDELIMLADEKMYEEKNLMKTNLDVIRKK